jgi:hypothetical protein
MNILKVKSDPVYLLKRYIFSIKLPTDEESCNIFFVYFVAVAEIFELFFMHQKTDHEIACLTFLHLATIFYKFYGRIALLNTSSVKKSSTAWQMSRFHYDLYA